MKYELTDYHRNIPDEEFISDIIHVARQKGMHTLTVDQYASQGKYHPSTLIRRFGSWKKVLEKAGLETKGHNFRCNITDEEVVSDVKRIALLLEKGSISAKEYRAYGKYSSSTLIKKYRGWNTVLSMAGMKPIENRNFTVEEMLEEIERVWTSLGRQPTSTDIKNGVSKYSLQSYARRFGGWRGALQAFADYINANDNESGSHPKTEKKQMSQKSIKGKQFQHSTSRDINLRLRFKVLQRDNFKCCACGASPAKDPSVVLHVDHIIPWSKGGETVIDNLQTYCSKCNLGKSDM